MAIDRHSKASVGSEQGLEKTTNFLKEVQTELQKTTWPTKEEALRLTYVVIGIIIAIGIYMGVLNSAFGSLIDHLVRLGHH